MVASTSCCGETNFTIFSKGATSKRRAFKIPIYFVEASLVMRLEYQSAATDYLFIGLLPSNQSLKVTKGWYPVRLTTWAYLDGHHDSTGIFSPRDRQRVKPLPNVR
ncbi:hypothetical protein OK016_03530 [Vibrio chagasii]|nr:hypothetical protein [Vibrio chagasii]